MRTVADLMSRWPEVVQADTPLRFCRQVMAEHAIRHLPVVDRRGRFVGLVSDFDVDRALCERGAGGTQLAGGITVPAAIRAHPDDPLVHALTRQLEARAEAVVVVDPDDRPVGVVTEHDGIGLAEVCLVPWLTVDDIATRPVIPVDDDRIVEEVLGWMLAERVRHAPVVGDGRVLGVVSFRDLASVPTEARPRVTVAARMSRPPVAVHPDEALTAAVRSMRENRVGCLPVVDRNRAPRAIVTRSDVIRALTRTLLKVGRRTA